MAVNKYAVNPKDFPPVHVLMCGDREWEDDYIVSIFVWGLKTWHGLNVHIWHGAATGADTHAANSAGNVQGIYVHPYPADWKRYGKKAGPIRNRTMLKAMLAKASESPESIVYGVAFKDDYRSRSGTRDMVLRMLKADLPVYVVTRPLIEELR